MNGSKSNTFLISVMGLDRVGVVSAVTSYLFEIGANLADSAYAVLGKGFEFSCVAEFEAAGAAEEVEDGLKSLELLAGARISVTPFQFDLVHGESGRITHTVEITGGDRPGLVARVSEVLVDYGANIVRMSSRRTASDEGFDYRTRFAINVEGARLDALKNALSNTAGSMRLNCSLEAV
jgi:glycine cleavage system transcriptional repressor